MSEDNQTQQPADGAATPPRRGGYVPVELDDATRARLEEEHGDILVLRGTEKSPWVMVVRRPTRQETLGYKAVSKRGDGTANESLLRRTTVFPTGADLERQLQRWPFLADGIADSGAFREFVGIAVEADLKG